MPDANESSKRGQCPKCASHLKYLGAVNEIQPFWNRIPQFFSYPLQPAPLILMAICTFTPLLMQSTMLAKFLSFTLLIVLTKYTYSVLEYTSQGRLKPPSVGDAFSGGKFSLAFQQAIVLIIMGLLVVGALHIGGTVLGLLVGGFLMLALPASIIILAMEEQIQEAVNPLRLLSLMGAIGWPYMVLYGYLILLVLAQSITLNFVEVHFTRSTIHPVSGLVLSYFSLVIFNMLGYLVFQYQDRLGYSADFQTDDLPSASLPVDKLQRLDADIDIALKEGRYEQVIGILTEQVAKFPSQGTRLEQLYKMLKVTENDATLMQFTQPLTRYFIKENKTSVAADILRRVWSFEPEYQLQDLELIRNLSRALYQSGDYKLVLRLCKNLHHRFENNPIVADCYLLLAQTLTNGMQQWNKAANYLNYIKKTFPDHPIQAHMPTLEAALATHRRLDIA
jgi:tetratricopeptide (TPR) repeat protein